jgi:hypothetical protein
LLFLSLENDNLKGVHVSNIWSFPIPIHSLATHRRYLSQASLALPEHPKVAVQLQRLAAYDCLTYYLASILQGSSHRLHK